VRHGTLFLVKMSCRDYLTEVPANDGLARRRQAHGAPVSRRRQVARGLRADVLARLGAQELHHSLTRIRHPRLQQRLAGTRHASDQGLTLVAISAQLELTLPLSARLKLNWSPI
jgi:hypothetical protein